MATPDELTEFKALLARSSLGSSAARELISRVTPEEVRTAVLGRRLKVVRIEGLSRDNGYGVAAPRLTEIVPGRHESAIQNLIDELGRLPGIGPKSAQRIAFHLLSADPDGVTRLVAALTEVEDKVRFCTVCGNVAESEQCRICLDPRRDQSLICVVEEPKDIVAIERTGEFRGRYHVLGGAISPIEGIGPDDLRVKELMTRLADGTVTEVIIATDPNLEGEATAAYLARLLGTLGRVQVSRRASALPVGGDLEHADEVTLGRVLTAVLRDYAASRTADVEDDPDHPNAAFKTELARDAEWIVDLVEIAMERAGTGDGPSSL